jgi:hypothetical protein
VRENSNRLSNGVEPLRMHSEEDRLTQNALRMELVQITDKTLRLRENQTPLGKQLEML